MNLRTLAQIGIAIALTPQGDLRLEALPGLLTAELLAQIAHSKPLLLEELGCQREHVNLVNLDSYGQAVVKDDVCAEQEVHSAQPTLSPEPEQVDPDRWRAPASTYNTHHFSCRYCQAAGRGDRYGQRCGTGMALWTAYQTVI